MDTTTRLLLPFTGNINALALSYAIQLAEQRHATLVPCALISVKSGKGARLDHIQQAQDFLEFTRRKAEQHGVPIKAFRLNTHSSVRSIETIASEMDCEAVLLFLCSTSEVLMNHAEVRELMDNAACNLHIVLLPAKRERRAASHPLYLPIPRSADEDALCSKSGVLLQEQTQENRSILHRIMQLGGARS